MLNRLQFVGNLGADPHIGTSDTGLRIVNFRMACTEKWRDANGKHHQSTEWIPVTVTNQVLAKVAMERLVKGSLVYVEGRWQTQQWVDKDGIARTTVEVLVGQQSSRLIVMTAPKGGGQAGDDAPPIGDDTDSI